MTIYSSQYLLREGHLPEFGRYLELEKKEDIVAPVNRDKELLPRWFEAYMRVKRKFSAEQVLL